MAGGGVRSIRPAINKMTEFGQIERGVSHSVLKIALALALVRVLPVSVEFCLSAGCLCQRLVVLLRCLQRYLVIAAAACVMAMSSPLLCACLRRFLTRLLSAESAVLLVIMAVSLRSSPFDCSGTNR